MRFGSKAVAIGTLWALLAGGTSWGQDTGGEFYSAKRATLRSDESDVALNDGSQYLKHQDFVSTLSDSAPGTVEGDPFDWDYLYFGPTNGRRLVLSSDLIDGDPGTQGNQPLVCEQNSYLFFGRFSGDRDWLEELAAVGDSTTGDASFQCWLDDPGSPRDVHHYYDVNWYNSSLQSSDQCVTYSRTETRTLRFEAPPATVNPLTGLPIPQDDGCPAEVFFVTRTKEDDPATPREYNYEFDSLGYESAPLELTAEFVGRFL